MSEVDAMVQIIAQVGFPITVAIYLLYERSKYQKEISDKWDLITNTTLEVIKMNTAAQTQLAATIQKLCEIVDRMEKR